MNYDHTQCQPPLISADRVMLFRTYSKLHLLCAEAEGIEVLRDSWNKEQSRLAASSSTTSTYFAAHRTADLRPIDRSCTSVAKAVLSLFVRRSASVDCWSHCKVTSSLHSRVLLGKAIGCFSLAVHTC